MERSVHTWIIGGLIGIFLALICNQFKIAVAIISLPLILLAIFLIFNYPKTGILILFTLNYFIMPLFRYSGGSGLSVLMDIALVFILFIAIINSSIRNNINWQQAKNGMVIVTFAWLCFCLVEILNPSASFSAWVSTRSLTYYAFFVTLLTSILCTKYKTVKTILFLLSIYSLLAIVKVIMQKYWGFDAYETDWLNKEGSKTHLIISGIRYFSFFTDASNFGSNMGFSGIVFFIIAFYSKKTIKLYYILVSTLCFYGMFLSGTRGAIIVPLAALGYLCIMSKSIKIIFLGGTGLLLIYIFFAFTNIGENNTQIRRMRTAFSPTQDASYLVRKENRMKLASYMKNKPIGEGLGLAGVEAAKHSQRFTTTIPTDSWLVRIWVQTGIIGLCFYLGMLFYGVIKSTYILMYKIKNKELQHTLSALICGVVGLIVSAYGNDFFGQFPTHIMVFILLTIGINAELYDKELDYKQNNLDKI